MGAAFQWDRGEARGKQSADHPFKNLGYEVKGRNGVEGVQNKTSWFCFGVFLPLKWGT